MHHKKFKPAKSQFLTFVEEGLIRSEFQREITVVDKKGSSKNFSG
jgi:hypothetical protein